MFSQLTQLDFSILDWIQSNIASAVLDPIMVVITTLGNAGLLWIFLGLLLCAFKKTRVCGILLLAGLLVGVLVGNVALKNLVARDRPCWIREMTELLIAVPKDYSFPSGHTLSSTIAAVVLVQYDRRIGIPACVLAVLIAFSRLYLFVHFPSDVVVALLLGVLIGILIWRLHPWLERKLADIGKKPEEPAS